MQKYTPPKTKLAPKIGYPKGNSSSNHWFQGRAVSFREGICFESLTINFVDENWYLIEAHHLFDYTPETT